MAEFSEKHQGTIMYQLKTYIFPRIGKTYIAKLETLDIMDVIKPLEQRGNNETSGECCKYQSGVRLCSHYRPGKVQYRS